MLLCLRRLIDAPAFTFAGVGTGLTTVDDTSFFEGLVTNDTTAFGAFLLCHLPFLLADLYLRSLNLLHLLAAFNDD